MAETEMAGPGSYLYGFARRGVLTDGPVLGLDGKTAVATCERGEVAAVFSLVDLSDFQGESGERNLQDPHWLVPRACAHQRVVEHIMASSPVLPVRFGAVFSSDDALAEFLSEHADAIAGFLQSISGKEEWSVKAYIQTERAMNAIIDADPELAERRRCLPASPGTRYFREKQLLAEARQRLHGWCASLAAEIERELRPLALDLRRLHARGTHPTVAQADLVLNFALLLPRGTVTALRSRIDELSAAQQANGLILECGGPWPPYNFCPALGAMPS